MFKAPKASALTPTLLATAALAAGSLLGMNPAVAHDELIATNPANGDTLTEAPTSLELTYSGEIMEVDGANQVRVTNSAGDSLTQGDPQIDGRVVTQDLAADAAADDTYIVTWRVVSSDGHPIQGSFTYTVGQGTGLVSSTTASSEVSDPVAISTDTASSTGEADEPVNLAGEGLTTPFKFVLVVLALATLGLALTVVLAKTKRK